MRGGIVPPRRPEGIRWLRSDGKPNFKDHIYRSEKDAKILARRPVYTTTKTATVLGAAEEMTRFNVRALPVVAPGKEEKLEGMLTSMDLVNYLGGGELYNIVVNRHRCNLFHALLREHVGSIMNSNPVYVTVYHTLADMLEVMVTRGVGVLPVVFEDMTLWGIITEHDLVHHLAEKKVGVRVEEVMTRNVVYISPSASIKEVAETMVKYGVRRLPLVEDDKVVGMVTAKDVVKFFGSHDAFRYAESDSLADVLKAPVKLIALSGYALIEPEADVGDAATVMAERGLSSLLVVKDGRLAGIITERDILYAVAAKPEAASKP